MTRPTDRAPAADLTGEHQLVSLLLSGGDARLHIDPCTGLNKYGAAPCPRPAAIALASCTASSVSAEGFAAAAAASRRMAAGDAARAAEAEAVRDGILAHFGVADLALCVLAASGTDATLIAMGLLAAEAGAAPITSILMSPTETGSGIPAAARGRHFAACVLCGAMVAPDTPAAGFPSDIALRIVALRAPDGALRSAAEIEADCARAAAAAARDGLAVLHAIDGSKTGLVAPGIDACARIASACPRVRILIDACQARLAPARLRRYLEQGWPVLVTGSKFFGGPAFSGAVLMPRAALARSLGNGLLPAGLAGYDATGNTGLILRWTAALDEMRRFAALPPAMAEAAFTRLVCTAEQLLSQDPRLRLIAAPPQDRDGWDGQRTVLAFTLADPQRPGRLLAPAELRTIHRWLNADIAASLPTDSTAAARAVARLPCHLGQPVQLGEDHHGPVGALRIAFGARAAAEPEATEAGLAGAVAKLSLILDHDASFAARAG